MALPWRRGPRHFLAEANKYLISSHICARSGVNRSFILFTICMFRHFISSIAICLFKPIDDRKSDFRLHFIIAVSVINNFIYRLGDTICSINVVMVFTNGRVNNINLAPASFLHKMTGPTDPRPSARRSGPPRPTVTLPSTGTEQGAWRQIIEETTSGICHNTPDAYSTLHRKGLLDRIMASGPFTAFGEIRR